jgi:hypothetical protein
MVLFDLYRMAFKENCCNSYGSVILPKKVKLIRGPWEKDCKSVWCPSKPFECIFEARGNKFWCFVSTIFIITRSRQLRMMASLFLFLSLFLCLNPSTAVLSLFIALLYFLFFLCFFFCRHFNLQNERQKELIFFPPCVGSTLLHTFIRSNLVFFPLNIAWQLCRWAFLNR